MAAGSVVVSVKGEGCALRVRVPDGDQELLIDVCRGWMRDQVHARGLSFRLSEDVALDDGGVALSVDRGCAPELELALEELRRALSGAVHGLRVCRGEV